MKKFVFAITLLVLLTLPFVVGAQEVEPGTGGPIIEGNFSGSMNFSSLNPLRCWGTDCSTLTGMMFPTLIGIDPGTATLAPDTPGGLAIDWDISDDGLTYIFTLRDDLFWTDGEPITAEDVAFTANALLTDQIEAPSYGQFVYTVEGVEVLDTYTIQFNLSSAACTALTDVAVPIVPAHVFADYLDMVGHEFDSNPSVSYGVFKFGEIIPGERVVLLANQDWVWAGGGVIPEGYMYPDVPDSTVEVERFLAGELNLMSAVPTDHRERVRSAENVQRFEYPSNSWGYIGLNLADPTNPQNGMDEEGNLIDQGNHPLFGDVRVRYALQRALDVEAIIDAAMFGEGVVMPSFDIQTSWAYNADIEGTYSYDPDAAIALFEEAGWVDHDGNPETPRVCQGCLYAEEGTEFVFELITNEGNDARYRMGVMAQDQLRQVGVKVDFVPMDFNTMIERSASQEYDAYLLGWSTGFPYDPDPSWFLSPEQDIIEWGFNDISYYNPEFVTLMEQAKTLPGCDVNERAEIYKQMQKIFMDDMPYLMIYGGQAMYAAAADIENWAPYANQLRWNIQQWVRQP